MKVHWWLAILVVIGIVAVSCAVPAPVPNSIAPTLTFFVEPQAEPALTATTPVEAYTEKVDLNSFAPPGLGRDLVILNCDNCHPYVCAFRGQRTVGHWQMVQDVHKTRKWVDLPDDQWNAIFSYLERNFNDQRPEPTFPPALEAAGCTQPPNE